MSAINSPIAFDSPSWSSGSRACQYQGPFEYMGTGGRSTCRKACDRTTRCTHYAHGYSFDGSDEECLLFIKR